MTRSLFLTVRAVRWRLAQPVEEFSGTPFRLLSSLSINGGAEATNTTFFRWSERSAPQRRVRADVGGPGMDSSA